MLYGLSKGLQPLEPRKANAENGYYGFRLRNVVAIPNYWWRIVEIEFCAGRGYAGKYNGTYDVIASSALTEEPAARVFDLNVTSTGTSFGSGWGSAQARTVLGQYIGMKVSDPIPLRSARFLTWGGTGGTEQVSETVALDVLRSPAGGSEVWQQIGILSGATGAGQWYGWESL